MPHFEKSALTHDKTAQITPNLTRWDNIRFVETSGVMGTTTRKFVAELGRRITGVTGDKRETAWLRQRIAIAIARGNSAVVMATGNHHAP